MSSIFDPSDRGKIVARLSNLTPDRRPLWGRLDAARVQTHLSDQLRMAVGDVVCKPKNTPFRYPVIQQLIVYVLPWPKGAPTAPELLATVPTEFEADRKVLVQLIERVGTRKPEEPFGDHPAFGRLSRRAWGVLAWRHLDHHLRQFGL
jgi:hypothetical protein